LAIVYALWFRCLGYRPVAAVAWGAAGIFCTPSWYYGTSTFDDILGTLAVVSAAAIMWMCRQRRPWLGAALSGLALGWAVNCKPPLILFALPALAALYRAEVPWRRQLATALLLVPGLALGIVFFKAYDAYKFPPGSDDIAALNVRMNGPIWTSNPVPGLMSLAVSPSCGALWYCPTLFLSWRGWRAWRERQRLFCVATLATALLFTCFISFLTFFKGEPGWGPRYLTPVFALFWVFVPAALQDVRVGLARATLALGATVQLLGLSVDSQRLFVQLPLHWNYYMVYPWLGFDATISHLLQRPREIVEVLSPDETPAPYYSPAPLPTHAGGLPTGPPVVASLGGLMGTPMGPGALNTVTTIRPAAQLQMPVLMQGAVQKYHIFRSPRPWVFSQWYLAERDRPVDLSGTLALGLGAALAGVVLAAVGCWAASRPGLPDSEPSG
jgi:hypothetical protein